MDIRGKPAKINDVRRVDEGDPFFAFEGITSDGEATDTGFRGSINSSSSVRRAKLERTSRNLAISGLEGLETILALLFLPDRDEKKRNSKPVTIIVLSSLLSRLFVLLNKRKIYEDGRKDVKTSRRIELG